MKARRSESAHFGLFVAALSVLFSLTSIAALAAPYAAMVVDARDGKVLHSRNADTRLHPASLTKMMTLYIAFEAVENGEISLDTKVKISRNAAAEPPSKLGLQSGQRIALRYLIRAAAVKSANDAATAIGEALEGSEAAFARRMNRTAKALGMSNTTFKNAHGLTESGHMSTARDMTTLGRHVLYDYPDYYNLFSRRSTSAGIKTVNNTNRRLLNAYRGADGIKTGYTRAAGFNLVASAERGNKRIIATVFGGRSTATRNAKVAELLDLGFTRSASRVALRKPGRPDYIGSNKGAGKTIRVTTAVKKSLRPKLRPTQGAPEAPKPAIVVAKAATPDASLVAAANVIEHDIQSALLQAQESSGATLAWVEPEPTPPPQPKVVTRISTAGGRHWGINVGRYGSRYAAEKMLLKTALAEMSTLDGSLRKVVKNTRGFEANFMGLSKETADLACRRLQARQITCYTLGPS
ncbi:D-alanyl-D-alanine carboxypeptidase family protein [Shimia sp. MMG029]|uniref:D-alanyl-D-alanine carboxypeptidase family protein n=1 Tax=Shimia sp. MMG029 TaxID=3021978 RepID=UPI0022FF1EDD|nr:D-alanyl-D-alanine carboxypeptidase family protein [Shimia sp. MMG029]MDA5557216.1 D-alanyl-D-alanine carboxypeptidase [Shimia sp. MMG029]